MQVLITTSPLACVASPPRSPKTVKPSSRTRTIASGMLHHTLRDHLPATDRHDDPAAYPPALKRRVLAAASEGRRVNRPLGSRIDQDPFVLQRLADDLSRPRDARAIDGARIAVVCGAQRRTDIAVWTHHVRIPRRQREVMGCGFGRHR